MTDNSTTWPIDTGRLRIRELDGICYCEAYLGDEFTLDDVLAIRAFILDHLGGKADIILKRVGTYSVSIEAQVHLRQGVDSFSNFVYLVDSERKRVSAEFAAETFMDQYHTRVCHSLEEAVDYLQQLHKT